MNNFEPEILSPVATIDILAPLNAEQGQTIVMAVSVSNAGNTTAEQLAIRILVPSALSGIPLSPGGSVSPLVAGGSVVSVAVDALPANATIRVFGQIAVPEQIAPGPISIRSEVLYRFTGPDGIVRLCHMEGKPFVLTVTEDEE